MTEQSNTNTSGQHSRRNWPHLKQNPRSGPTQRRRVDGSLRPRSTPGAAATSNPRRLNVSSVRGSHLYPWKGPPSGCVPALQCSPPAFLRQHYGTWGFPWDLFLRHDAPADERAPSNDACEPRALMIWNFKMAERKSKCSTSQQGLKRSLQSSSQKLSRGHSWVWFQKHDTSLNAKLTFILW